MKINENILIDIGLLNERYLFYNLLYNLLYILLHNLL